MIRALLFAALLLVPACGSSPCDGVQGACLGIRITSGPQIDQLAVVLSRAVTYGARTPSVPGALRRPPLETAVELPDDASGMLHVVIFGMRAGVEIAHADGATTIVAGGRQTIELALDTTFADGGLVDLGADDLAGADLAHVDLAHVDLAGADLSAQVRYLFVLPTQAATVGNAITADQACTTAAQAANLGGSTAVWHALIGYAGDGGDPYSRLNAGEGRPVVLPDGQSLWPSGKIFNGGDPPMHGLDELANGAPVAASCVWTGFGAAGSTLGRGTCANWTYAGSDIDAAFAYVGTTESGDMLSWAYDNFITCSQSCHVYCLEQ